LKRIFAGGISPLAYRLTEPEGKSIVGMENIGMSAILSFVAFMVNNVFGMLPLLLAGRIASDDELTPEYTQHFALQVMALTISVPYQTLKFAGVFQLAGLLVNTHPLTAEEFADKYRSVAQKMGAGIASAFTPDVFNIASQLLLYKLLQLDELPDEDDLNHYSHLVMAMAQDHLGIAPDREALAAQMTGSGLGDMLRDALKEAGLGDRSPFDDDGLSDMIRRARRNRRSL
jgi:hypothetical protein